jgi:hypothetical protein
MSNEIKKIIEEIVEKNNWLNGIYDYLDGDVLAIVNQPEKFEEAKEEMDLRELYNDLREFEGVFQYKNLLFFNDWQYGTFVYSIDNTEDYIEHLTMDAIPFDHFIKIIERLL